MSILPPNKPQKTVDTPKNFFIYGATMNGKSYLASEFPNPLFLDTDGNASANPYPSVQLRNIRGKSGKIERSVVDQFDEIITELQTTKHTYETVVLDVIDDIVVMIEQYICDREGVETIGDIGYGKGYAAFSNIFQQLVIELKALPINVVYVSRISTREENNVTYEIPSLKTKHVNIVNGNCDYMIQAKKVGKNYIRIAKEKRKNYQRDQIADQRILTILDTVTNAFEKTRKVDKAKQDEIVKKLDQEIEEKVVEVAPEATKEPEPTPEPINAPAPTNNTQGVVRNRPRPQV
ncbi:AAA family ATPase [Aerococcus sp. 1KP-2016]|uniref:AAA family ATPase n=1 Tax=Aerococcus sp. 1KP-2016 TaxID=1981982 RepID=UPI000B98E825|nr:AAA family ATPase [Aerococcus sp. 1KP-2016]OYQ68291.1 alpha/beta hydrolase [Aerococcus sp. 1KP-2016]